MVERWYVGYSTLRGCDPFTSKTIPTQAKYGDKYDRVIGPFKTVGGAHYYAEHVYENPNLSVGQANRRAHREYKQLISYNFDKGY